MLSELHSFSVKFFLENSTKKCFATDCGATAQQCLATKLLNQNKKGGSSNEQSMYSVMSMA